MIIVHGGVGSAELGVLVAFRQGFYGCLVRRGDALFELTDAVMARPERVDSVPALSLEPEFRRGHGALYGALSNGQVDVARLRTLLLDTVAPGREGVRWFAGDVSNLARPDAVTSPERLAVHDRSARTVSGRPVTSGYPWAVMVALESGPTSWTAPVDAVRLRPADTLTQVTLDMAKRVIAGLIAAGRRETAGFVFDSEYDLMALSHELGATTHILGRLRSNQTFHADPEPTPGPRGRGAPSRHGKKIKLNDPATLTTPDRAAVTHNTRYGKVTISSWDNQHRRITRAGYWTEHPGKMPIVRQCDPYRDRTPPRRRCTGQADVALARRTRPAEPGHPVHDLPAPLRPRTHLPVPQTRPRLDRIHSDAAHHRRDLDLAHPGRLHPTPPHPNALPRPPDALGKTPNTRPDHPPTSPPRYPASSPTHQHPRQPTKKHPTRPRTTPRHHKTTPPTPPHPHQKPQKGHHNQTQTLKLKGPFIAGFAALRRPPGTHGEGRHGNADR